MKCKVLCVNCGQRLFDLDVREHAKGHVEIKCTKCRQVVEVSLENAMSRNLAFIS